MNYANVKFEILDFLKIILKNELFILKIMHACIRARNNH